jgi:cation diffusion facilitator CzcD-associated flavoprotein CzcO
MQQLQHYKCVIVGSGFSGICLAIRLKQSGIDDFVLLEKAQEIGGTWRDNHYPGAECDVPSALYSFSFETKTDWDYQWSEQSQILEYIHNTARIHGITAHVRLGRELGAADYDAANARWTLQLANGEALTAQFLVSAVGQLHKPNIPRFDGADSFRGPAFHSANWQHDIDLRGKSVCVIGNAASATQFIPFVAQQAARLTVFQRSASWVSQKRDKPYTERQKKWMRRFPFTKRLERLSIYLRNELIAYPALKGRRLNKWLLKMACLNYLNSVVTDATLRQKLLPDYPVGAKRILIVEGYYEALMQGNVELVTAAIEAIDATGIRTCDGNHYPCDVIIYGTGFITNPFLDGIRIRGRSGALLAEHWAAGAHAYLGITTSDFPNLFFMYGPNTNLGHNSILLMAESQANYILQAIRSTQHCAAASLEVRAEVETEYNRTLQERLHRMVWDSVATSWYKSDGRITNNWPGSVGEYRKVTRRFRASDYAVSQLGYSAEMDTASQASSRR